MEKPSNNDTFPDLDLSATINGLTPSEWNSIKVKIKKLVEENMFQKDYVKCTVHAFIEFLIENDYQLAIDEIETVSNSIH